MDYINFYHFYILIIMTKLNLLPSSDAFLGLAEEDAASYENAKAVVIPFGLEASVSYGGGTKHGAQAMLKASHQVELFDEDLWCEPFRKYGVVTVCEPEIDNTNIPKALEILENLTTKVLDDGKFPIIFGGEHSITAGSIRPFAKKYPDLHMLHFDAHADLRDGYNGEHYSHAAAIRRCLDHEHIGIVSCGIRNISASEVPFLESNRHRINIHWGKDRRNWNIDEIVAPLKGKPVYLTFDLDGFDGSLMAATGTPEPGGIFWDDAMAIIKAASKICTIVGADVNELAPRPELHACDFLAAKLAYKILNYALVK